jgi:GntR family transcriptional repressor for pyruvate dehydrogenase complex
MEGNTSVNMPTTLPDGLSHPNGRSSLSVNRIQPAYAQVASQLRDLIVTGQIQTGDHLPNESELATIFGVSRSTVREALRSLAAQSLVYTRRGVTGGTFVAELNAETVSAYLRTSLGLMSGSAGVTVAELLETRAALEVPATRLAAIRRTNDAIQEMEQNLSISNVEDEAVRFGKNSRFHELIMEASGNRLLGLVASPVFDVLKSRFRREDVEKNYWEQVDHDHREIFSHIEAGDPDGAESAMRAHLRRLESTYESIDITTHPSRKSPLGAKT